MIKRRQSEKRTVRRLRETIDHCVAVKNPMPARMAAKVSHQRQL
jgi:hypothetical protein